MKPILYRPEEMTFETNGVGVLYDAVSCVVTEELNGMYELTLKYPMEGAYFNDISYRYIILAKPNGKDRAQPFRIYKISKPMNGIITVNAEHISYDLGGVQVSPYVATDAAEALDKIGSNTVTETPFAFHTSRLTTGYLKVKTPRSARACLLGENDSVLSTYGGEFIFDRYRVELLEARGSDNGHSIRYGVNLTDIKQEQNCANTYTGIYPYWWSDEDGELVELPERVLNVPGDLGYTRIKNVDLTSEFDTKPTVVQLRVKAQEYLNNNDISRPVVNITVKFEQLRPYDEYKDLEFLEDVYIGDTVSVKFEKLGVDANAKCCKVVYDSILEKYNTIELGSLKQTVADKVVSLENQASYFYGMAKNIATVTAVTTANSAKLELLVETDAEGNNSVRGSILIEAINDDESEIVLNADKINLKGYVTLTDVQRGSTIINGACIKTGKVAAQYIEADKLEVSAANIYGTLDATKANLGDVEINAANVTGTLNAAKVHIEELSGLSAKLGFINGGKLRSHGYTAEDDILNGFLIDLDKGTFESPGFKIDSSGDVTIANVHVKKNVLITPPTTGVSGDPDKIPLMTVKAFGLEYTVYFDRYTASDGVLRVM